MTETEKTKCLIIGSGPAGYTAAIYAARANLNPIVYEGMHPGGQLTYTTDVENFPGYPDGVQGAQMMDDIRRQALRFNADLRQGEVATVDFSIHPYRVTTNNGDTVEAQTLIIATGASAKYLGLPDEHKYAGRGVSACATCDGFFFRKKKVAVVGGGDTACEAALYLSNMCEQVYMVVRKPFLRASKIMQHKVFAASNIEILFECNTAGLYGEEKLEGMRLIHRQGTADETTMEVPVSGFFLAIGHSPNTAPFHHALHTDEQGYLLTKPNSTETNLPGVFAAGDVADGVYMQAITAAASGCKAAIEAERFLL